MIMTTLAPNWSHPALEGMGLDQDKIAYLWQYSHERAGDVGDTVARFCLAILPQEGTGSFDTSSANKAADGGNGIEPDWQVDVQKAVDLVVGKLELYQQALGQGFGSFARRVESPTAGQCDGGPDQWVNWATAVVRTDGTVEAGACYAQHASWWYGVRQHYRTFGGTAQALIEAASYLDRRAPRVTFTMRYVEKETGLASNWNGTTPEPAVVVKELTATAPANPPKPVTVVLPSGTVRGELRDGHTWALIGDVWAPLSTWAGALGFTVTWDGASPTATVKLPAPAAPIPINVSVNGAVIACDAKIVGEHTYVLLRPLAEALGASVGWDGETKTVVVTRG